jgi:hypothetical protein
MMITNDCRSEVFLVVGGSEKNLGQGVSKLLRRKVIKIITRYIWNLIFIYNLIVKSVC